MANTAAEPPTHSDLRDNRLPNSAFMDHGDDHGGEDGIGLTSAEIKMLLEHDEHSLESEPEPKPVVEGKVEAIPIDTQSIPLDSRAANPPGSIDAEEPKTPSPIKNGAGGKRAEKLPPTKKFLFETFFDQNYLEPVGLDGEAAAEFEPAAEPIHIEPLPPLPPALYNQAQLDAACAAARAEGEAMTRAELMATESHQQLELLQQLAQQIPQACDQHQAEFDRLTAEVARVAVALVAKILPDYTRQNGAAEIAAFVCSTIDYALGRAKLRLRIHPQNLEFLQTQIHTIAASHGFTGKVEVVEDMNLAAADVVMDWGDGSAEKIEQRIWQAITDLVPPTKPADERILPPD